MRLSGRYGASNVGRTDVDTEWKKEEGKKKDEGEGKGKGRWKEDSLRNVGRTDARTDTQVILYFV